MTTKTHSKNFSSDEIAMIVDLVHENKSKLFGSLSSSLSYDDKNHVWETIAREISEAHGTFRNKGDVTKKWSNVLAKHKPIICDKIYSARRTGGGCPTAELTELETMLKSIKEKELFDGVHGGIDVSSPSPISPLSDCDMSIAEDTRPTRKRSLSDEGNLTNATLKKALLESEQEKITLLRGIDDKIDKMLDLLGQIVSNNKLQSSTIQQQQQVHPPHLHGYYSTPTAMFPPVASQSFPPRFMQQHPSND